MIIFIYDHFYPDFTAGGPITSLNNLGNLLAGNIRLKVVTSAYQYQSGAILKEVEKDNWTVWKQLPVWYATSSSSVAKALATTERDQPIVYLNGVFSIRYFLLPLWISFRKRYRVVVSPRGMLQAGALNNGALKKKLFLQFLKLSGLLKNVRWHVTDKQEADDTKNIFQVKNDIVIIPNVPVVRQLSENIVSKQPGKLRLVYFSLISEKKNLLFLIKLLSRPALAGVTLDIVGPVKDHAYWTRCRNEINHLGLEERIIYSAEVSPEKSTALLQSFHALALPTLGENFGHAIVETLGSSRPVIISDKTPWTDLEQNNAGFSLALTEEQWEIALIRMMAWTAEEFTMHCHSAFNYYHHKFDFEKLKADYIKLFTSN